MIMAAKSKGPQFVRFFGPVIDALRALGGSGSPDEVATKIAEMLQIPQKQQEELTSSGQQRFLNQVQWARFYLSRGGFISSTERGVWSLADKGRNKTLTQEEALEVFNKVRKIFEEERRLAKLAKPETETEDSEAPGTFTADARKEALRDGARPIELVDGQKLIQMFEHLQLGLKPIKAFEVDVDFFDDFRESGEQEAQDETK
jgi:restriction system protein